MIKSLSSLVFLLLIVKIGCNLLKRNSWAFGFYLFLNILFPLSFKSIEDEGPTGFFPSSSRSVVSGQRESIQTLGASSACIGFGEVCASGEESPENIKGFGLGRREAEVEIDLDDEPGLLLDSLNFWLEKVAVGEFPRILGLSRPIELKLLKLITSQLDHELFIIV